MIHETDLPCSDCGAALRERPIDAHELPVDPVLDEEVIVAECEACGARHYPERTLARVRRSTTNTSSGGA